MTRSGDGDADRRERLRTDVQRLQFREDDDAVVSDGHSRRHFPSYRSGPRWRHTLLDHVRSADQSQPRFRYQLHNRWVIAWV